MTSVSIAKQIISTSIPSLTAETRPLADSQGMILAAPVFSPVDMPPFDQSAMDGYALQFADAGNPLQVVGEVQAGVAPEGPIKKSTAMRIFTGAAVPEGADTVVMQEKVHRENNLLYLEDPDLKSGANVRPRASQTSKGDLVLPEGTLINPAVIGLLAGLGITTVDVWTKPRVGLIITGKELAKPGTSLQPGQVYESNSFTLIAALQELGIQPELVFRCDDDEPEIIRCLQTVLESCDIALCTGGISVGDYDLVKKALDYCGVETGFYKVKQKPGKPLFYGKKDQKRVFALPGNPGSVLTCYYEYVEPLLQQMMGRKDSFPRTTQKILGETVTKKAGLTHFLKGKIDGQQVVPLHAQESYKMNGFALADCLIVLDEEATTIEKGQMVEVHLVNPI
jgi:molybdopterin molybdotransferase